MRVDPTKTQTPTAPKLREPKGHTTPTANHRPAAQGHGHDGVTLSDHATHAVHGDDSMYGSVEHFAHQTHSTHGAMHVIEAIEQGAGSVAARLAGRAASTAAEANEAAEAVAHATHHHGGILHKAEAVVEKGVVKAAGWLGSLVRQIPGGERVMQGLNAVWRAPGRLMEGADSLLKGTRVGQALKLGGSGGRLVSRMGGRVPILGAVLGGAIAVVDVKGAIDTLNDPKATTGQKWIAGTQGALSGVSGALGVGALAVAGAAAIGLTAPISVPVLLGAAAITGAGAFVLSFFKH